MNIGIIISAFTNGGAQRVAVSLSRWLNEHEQKSCIIALSESNKNQYDASDVDLVRLKLNNKGSSIIKRLKTFDQDNNIDAYIVMGVPMCMYVMPALRGTYAKIIVSERNDPRNFQGKTSTKIVSRWLMNRADGFVFQTNDASDFYKKYKSKSVVIPNPVADVPAVTDRTPNRLREKTIVTAGRLVSQKNHEMLIKAFSKIAGIFPDYKLVIYGEGDLKNELEKIAKDEGVGEKVFFPGSVNDLHQRIINSELFVLSSDFEGMPNALMEAMAMGLTSISTDCPCGGPKELIESGKNGFLIPVGDVEACAAKMAECLKNKGDADEIGYAALEAKNKYSKNTVCRKWLDYIKSVVGR